MAARIKELCNECEELVNNVCENKTDIMVLQSYLDVLNEGQVHLGKLRGKIIKRASRINHASNI